MVPEDVHTPGGDEEEEKRDLDSEVLFLKEMFPSFEKPIIQKVLEEKQTFE